MAKEQIETKYKTEHGAWQKSLICKACGWVPIGTIKVIVYPLTKTRRSTNWRLPSASAVCPECGEYTTKAIVRPVFYHTYITATKDRLWGLLSDSVEKKHSVTSGKSEVKEEK